MSGFAPAEDPRPTSVRDRLRRAVLEVAILDAIVIAVCTVAAALLGEFHRSGVGVLVLACGGLALLVGAVSAGALPMFNSSNMGSLSYMNYANTMHAELMLQEELRTPAGAADARKRRRFGLQVVVIGLTLVVLGMFIGG